MKIKKHKYLFILAIFIASLIVRFAYYPQNIYFSFDQARDFYFASEILKGDIRIIGPPSAASPNLFPGPLALYIYAFIQLIFGMSPVVMSIFFRIYNALGVILVFIIAKKIFDRKVAVLTSILYAISYEQSQYSLLMSHQPLAILPVLLFYLGSFMLFFERKQLGLVFALLGLGLAIQFHFVYLFLLPMAFAYFVIFSKKIHELNFKYIFLSALVFLATISTYIISELKFGFRALNTLLSSESNSVLHLNEGWYATNRFIHDTFLANYKLTIYVLILTIFLFVYYLVRPKLKDKGIFLLMWFVGGILPYLISGTKGYYYSAGATVSLLILFSSLVLGLSRKYRFVGVILIMGVIVNNLILIRDQNPKGPNLEIIIQPGMLLGEEQKVLDYIYQDASGAEFAVNALTVPLNINTTWSYLFEWYGKGKYGYLPIWSVKPAEGFPSRLPYEVSRSKLPEKQFVILEPLDGIRKEDKEKFFAEEGYFSEVSEKKQFGNIIVQKRQKI